VVLRGHFPLTDRPGRAPAHAAPEALC